MKEKRLLFKAALCAAALPFTFVSHASAQSENSSFDFHKLIAIVAARLTQLEESIKKLSSIGDIFPHVFNKSYRESPNSAKYLHYRITPNAGEWTTIIDLDRDMKFAAPFLLMIGVGGSDRRKSHGIFLISERNSGWWEANLISGMNTSAHIRLMKGRIEVFSDDTLWVYGRISAAVAIGIHL